jgi:Zn-dependent protease
VNSTILTFLYAAIPLVIGITLHEAAHGYAAAALGDDTAKKLGRLSLNPFVHVDRVGTILIPGILLLLRAGFLFGWAKPVPVSAWRFAHPRRDMALVAAAGPLMNFGLAWLAALALYGQALLPPDDVLTFQRFIVLFIRVNIGLAVFNLLPIPPLDGGRIVVGILPERLAAVWARLERAGLLIVLLVVFLLPTLLRDVGIDFDPVGHWLPLLIMRGTILFLRLAGHDVGN